MLSDSNSCKLQIKFDYTKKIRAYKLVLIGKQLKQGRAKQKPKYAHIHIYSQSNKYS